MQQNVNSSKVRKQWAVFHDHLTLLVAPSPSTTIVCSRSVLGASPAYLESMIEELNIEINAMLYALERIPR